MMQDAIYFHTPGRIPLESFTNFGFNSKPESSDPIGFFGTGLKYVVAVLLRMGVGMSVFIGEREYDFYTSKKVFRGKDFQICRMRHRTVLEHLVPSSWRSSALPYTTELGKNWELWMVYRELASNTFDENGTVSNEPLNPFGPEGTTIRVPSSEMSEISSRGDVFMKAGPKVFEDKVFSMYEGESKYMYYRGVRVYELRHPSRFTYDFKPKAVSLTEDRTAANIWSLQWNIAWALRNSLTDRKLLKRIMEKRSDPTFEGEDAYFDYSGGESDAFMSMASQMRGSLSRSAANFYAMATTRVEKSKRVALLLTQEELKLLHHCLTVVPGGREDRGKLAGRVALLMSPQEEEIPF